MSKNKKYSSINLIKCPLLTDKTTRLLKNNQYTFIVHPKITKNEIKTTIEFLFNVKVKKVNTCYQAKKIRRAGPYSGLETRYKKAVIKLMKGSSIRLFSET